MNIPVTPVKMLIKDFKVPSPNGNTYNLEDPTTIEAINKFCIKPVHRAEHGNPNVNDIVSAEDRMKRVVSIHDENTVAEFSELQFNKEEGTITAFVKPVGGRMPFLLEQLERKEVVFGMRALVNIGQAGYKNMSIVNIITFDVINPGQ